MKCPKCNSELTCNRCRAAAGGSVKTAKGFGSANGAEYQKRAHEAWRKIREAKNDSELRQTT